jgi:ABC-type phosphate transport system auxiliary subunit
MKTEISIALIICGTILIIAPPASDYLYRQDVKQVLIEKPDATTVTFSGDVMSEEYRIACWMVGTGMIVVTVIASIAAARRQAAAHHHDGPAAAGPPGSDREIA